MSNSDGYLFYTKKKKKLIKENIFLKVYKYTEIHYLQSKFPSVYSYCLVNLGHTLYILYHLTFVVIVWLYAIKNYGPYGFYLGTGWQNYFKTTDLKQRNAPPGTWPLFRRRL